LKSGEGEVLIENDEGCCVLLKASSAVLRSMRFRSGVSARGEAMHAIVVHGHFVRLADCEVRAASAGIYLTNDKAQASVVRTRVALEGGLLAMEGCTVVGSELGNVQVGGESKARLVDTKLEGAKQTGLTVIKGGSVIATRCESRENLAGADVTLGGSLELVSCRVVENAGGGVRVFGAASKLRASGGRIADNGAVNVGGRRGHRSHTRRRGDRGRSARRMGGPERANRSKAVVSAAAVTACAARRTAARSRSPTARSTISSRSKRSAQRGVQR
jgi:hypothetical protein